MGTEVSHRFFQAEDFSRFRQCLEEETALLKTVFDQQGFSPRGDVAGFEMEAWLVDDAGHPVSENERFLERLASPLVVPELAKFNVELNGSPCALTGRVFTRLHDELAATWDKCQRAADEVGCHLVTIGTLPTAKENLFVADNMSTMVRYQSLNDRVMALRDGQRLKIEIDGDDPLYLLHDDVMLEAAATSFQIHLQCRPERATREFNASVISAAALVAVGANSPFLFGRTLWDESRIPLFEQSVHVGERNKPRVTFGSGYVQDSLFEIFDENCHDHLILIPMVQDAPPSRFSHLSFQNGTMWRWVRPLIGFDFDGQVHLRIEQRVPSAGPTLKDSIANAAFYFGMVRAMADLDQGLELVIDFADAKENFYNAARYGLGAHVCWSRSGQLQEVAIDQLIKHELLPMARDGLASLDIPQAEIDEYLGIIAARVENLQNGAAWQRRWMQRNGGSLGELVSAYRVHQDTNEPVHTWPI